MGHDVLCAAVEQKDSSPFATAGCYESSVRLRKSSARLFPSRENAFGKMSAAVDSKKDEGAGLVPLDGMHG